MNINVSAFLKTLPIMGQGMLSIFAVMVVIGLIILLLNKATEKKSPEEENQGQ